MIKKIFQDYYGIITGLIAFVLYMTTLAPSVIEIDSGELTAVQALAGIAHPTGYPLFTIIGYLFSLIPLPMSTVLQLNMLAALFCSVATALFSLTAKEALLYVGNPQVKEKTKKRNKKVKQENTVAFVSQFSEQVQAIAASITGLVIAFSATYWYQSHSVEVYSLHVLNLSLILYFLVRTITAQSEEQSKKMWIGFAVALALGFSNHMTTILVIPGAAYFYFSQFGFRKTAFTFVGKMLLYFLPIIIVTYLYLVLRASMEPMLNWGNPSTLDTFLRHVSGKQYQVWMFSSMDAAMEQLRHFFALLPKEFSSGYLFIISGLIVAFLRSKKIFLFLLINIIVTVLYAINYDIKDIDTYFLLAFISLGLFSVFGILHLYSLLQKVKVHNAAIMAIFLIILSAQVWVNYSDVDQSGTYTFEQYTKNILDYCEEDAIILTYQWDYFLSPSYYFQYVENYRRDVAVIGKELLRRSWYYKQIETIFPDIYKSIKPEIDIFLQEVAPFEEDKSYNPQTLDMSYRNVMTRLISENIDERPVYIGAELFDTELQSGELRLPEDCTLIPANFMFKVVKTTDYVPVPDPDFKIDFSKQENYYVRFIQYLVGTMLVRRAMYEYDYKKYDKVKLLVSKLKTDFPNARIPQHLLKVM